MKLTDVMEDALLPFWGAQPCLGSIQRPPPPPLPHPSLYGNVGIFDTFADLQQPPLAGNVHIKKKFNQNEIRETIEMDCTFFRSLSTMTKQKFGSRFDA